MEETALSAKGGLPSSRPLSPSLFLCNFHIAQLIFLLIIDELATDLVNPRAEVLDGLSTLEPAIASRTSPLHEREMHSSLPLFSRFTSVTVRCVHRYTQRVGLARLWPRRRTTPRRLLFDPLIESLINDYWAFNHWVGRAYIHRALSTMAGTLDSHWFSKILIAARSRFLLFLPPCHDSMMYDATPAMVIIF